MLPRKSGPYDLTKSEAASTLLKLLILYYLFRNDNKIVEDVINISDEEENVKRKGGRQCDPVWNHFESKSLKTLKHFSVKCKHCDANFSYG